jgi:hypothetical protein
MKSYRFPRRTFLSALGGAFGLHALLRNMEAAAQGVGAPPRFLMVGWPCGSVKYPFVPMGTGTEYTASTMYGEPGYIISPFATPELKPHVHIFNGFRMDPMTTNGGGAHEAGTPFSTTGAHCPGTRRNGGETDDGCAGGPSWDQILLKHCPELTTTGRGYYNVICDSRVDSYETSTRCLSYSYTKSTITSASGGMISENSPLRPTLSPLTAFNDLFSGFMPGVGGTDEDALRRLKQEKSVLDNSLREQQALYDMAPANERIKIEATLNIIRQMEMSLVEKINNPPMVGDCTVPMAPPMNLSGQNSDQTSYGQGGASNADDAANHAAVGAAHSDIIRAAFACDLIRVASFQWSPGTNHVSFKGADRNAPDRSYMHHPLSHQNLNSGFYTGSPPSGGQRYIWDAMTYVQHWYFTETAKFVAKFLAQVDPLDANGGSLLERTVMTAISEVGNPSHDRNGASALIIGGSKLGMQPGGFHTVNNHHNSVWLTTAQAFLGADPMSKLNDEVFQKDDSQHTVEVIPGIWTAPPPTV